jgi:hypothetical protein
MTLLDLLCHQWRQRTRSPTFGRSLIGGLFLLLAAAYFGVLFVAAGWFYPQIVAEVAPQVDPLGLLNEHLLYALVGLTVGRFFLQRSAGSALQPYLSLPIRQGKLVWVLQCISALSLFNLLPVVVLAVLWGSTVVPAASPVGAATWTTGTLLAVAFTEFANGFLRAVWDRSAALVLGGAGGLAGLIAGGRALGVGVLPAASSWLFGGLSAGSVLPLVVLGAGTVGMAGATHWALRTQLYDVLERGDAGAGPAGAPLPLLRGRWGAHPAVSFALLDAKLILRNRRPRQMLALNLSVWVMFGFIVAEGDISSFNQVLFGFILSGHLALGYFQYGHAWHGMHFDGVLARGVLPAALVRGQYLTFAGLAAAPVAVMVPVVAWMRPEFLRPIGAFFLFNLGVSAPFLIGVGVWFRDALHLNESAFFNYQGTSSLHVLSFVLLMGFPMGLAIGLGKPTAVLVGTGLGVLGIATAPFWTRGLGRLLYGQRHAMAAGFRNTGE